VYFKDNVLKQEGIQYKGKNKALATLKQYYSTTDALVTSFGTRRPIPFVPALGFFLLHFGAGGGEREHKKATSKEVMVLPFQLVPFSTDKLFICF